MKVLSQRLPDCKAGWRKVCNWSSWGTVRSWWQKLWLSKSSSLCIYGGGEGGRWWIELNKRMTTTIITAINVSQSVIIIIDLEQPQYEVLIVRNKTDEHNFKLARCLHMWLHTQGQLCLWRTAAVPKTQIFHKLWSCQPQYFSGTQTPELARKHHIYFIALYVL